MASVTVTVGDAPSTVDLDDPAGMVGFIAAVQCLALLQQGIEATPQEMLDAIGPEQPVTILFNTDPASDDEDDTLARLSDLVDRGVLSEDEFAAKKAALTT